jgi:hypothetical protein
MIKNNIKNLSVVLVIVIATIIQTINGSINNIMVTKVLGQSDFEDAFEGVPNPELDPLGHALALNAFKSNVLDAAGSPGAGGNFFEFLDTFNSGNLTLFAPINAVVSVAAADIADLLTNHPAQAVGLLMNHVVLDLVDVPDGPGLPAVHYTTQPFPADGSDGFQFIRIVPNNNAIDPTSPDHPIVIFGAPVDGSSGVSPISGNLPSAFGAIQGQPIGFVDVENSAGMTIRVYSFGGIMVTKSFENILIDANLTEAQDQLLTFTNTKTKLNDLVIGTLVFPSPEALAEALAGDEDDEESDSTAGVPPGADVLNALERLFASHIIPGQRLLFSDLFGLNGQTLDTLDEHTKLTVTVDGSTVYLNGVEVNAQQSNLVSSQGVMHILGGVLQPAEIPFTRAPAPDSSATQGVFVNASMFLFALSAIIATMF